MRVLLTLATTLWAALSLSAAQYTVDPVHSQVGFKANHLMIAEVYGEFTDYKATIDFDPETKTLKAFEGVVKTASLDTGVDKRDNHLRSGDFFDSKKFPEMRLMMTDQIGNRLMGELTIKGITKPVTFEYATGGVLIDPWGNERIGFTLKGSVNRFDFDVDWNKALKGGGDMVGETIDIFVVVEATRKP